MSVPTTEVLHVNLTVIRAPAETMLNTTKTVVMPADKLPEFIEQLETFFAMGVTPISE